MPNQTDTSARKDVGHMLYTLMIRHVGKPEGHLGPNETSSIQVGAMSVFSLFHRHNGFCRKKT